MINPNLENVARVGEFIDSPSPAGSMVLIVGALGVGKTTMARELASIKGAPRLDWDRWDSLKNCSEHQLIQQALLGRMQEAVCTIAASGFSQEWAKGVDAPSLKLGGRLLIVNLIADNDTRYSNLHKRSNNPPQTIMEYLDNSPDYISPLAGLVLDWSEGSRLSPDEIRSALS